MQLKCNFNNNIIIIIIIIINNNNINNNNNNNNNNNKSLYDTIKFLLHHYIWIELTKLIKSID
jgi:hypothetical protein